MDIILNSLNIDKAELFQNLFCHVNTGICLFNLNHKIIFLNHIYAELLGGDEQKLIGKKFECSYVTEDENGCTDGLEALLEYDAEPIRFDREFVKESGETVYGILETKCLFDSKKEPVAFLSSFIDISQRKISEHEILLQNKNYKKISDFAYNLASFPHYQVIIDFLLEQIRSVTGAGLAGYSEFVEEPGGMYLEIKSNSFKSGKVESLLERFSDILKKNRIPVDEQGLSRIINTNVIHVKSLKELTFGAFSGAQDLLVKKVLGITQYYGLALTDPLSNRLLGTILIGFDDKCILPSFDFMQSIINIASNIVTRRRSEKKLIESEQLFGQVINSSSDGIVVVDRDFVHQVWNRGAENVFAKSSKEVIGIRNLKRDWRIFRTDGSEYGHEELPLNRLFRTGEAVEDEIVRIVNRRNESHWLKLNMQPIKTVINKVCDQAVITFSEITELKVLEEELKASLKKEELLYHELRHRIKNTLSMIISIIELELINDQTEKTADSLSAVKSRVETFSGLYSMFDYSQANPDVVRMDNFLSEIFASIQKAFRSNNFYIEYINTLEPVSLPSDEAASWGLILNELLTNAYKYAFEKDGFYRIEIDFVETPGGLELTVANNGKRLPDDFNLNASHGLGLKLISVLINQLNGDFSFSSDDEKTVFTVRVKTAEQAESV